MIIFIGGSSKENEVARHQQGDGTCFFCRSYESKFQPLHNSKDSREISAVLGLLEIWTWCSQRACWKNNLKAIRNPQNPHRFYNGGIRFAFQNKSNGYLWRRDLRHGTQFVKMCMAGKSLYPTDPYVSAKVRGGLVLSFVFALWPIGSMGLVLIDLHYTYIHLASNINQIWVVVSNILYFHHYLGKWSNLTTIFRWVETTNQKYMDDMGKKKKINGCLALVLGSSHSFIIGLVWLSDLLIEIIWRTGEQEIWTDQR